MAYETKTGIFTSKTQEDIKVLGWWVKVEDEASLQVTRAIKVKEKMVKKSWKEEGKLRKKEIKTLSGCANDSWN